MDFPEDIVIIETSARDFCQLITGMKIWRSWRHCNIKSERIQEVSKCRTGSETENRWTKYSLLGTRQRLGIALRRAVVIIHLF